MKPFHSGGYAKPTDRPTGGHVAIMKPKENKMPRKNPRPQAKIRHARKLAKNERLRDRKKSRNPKAAARLAAKLSAIFESVVK